MKYSAAQKSRTIFWIIFFLSGGIFWLADHPPMIDIPQHAGQVALLLDFINNAPARKEYFYINYFTPYLLGYGLWTLLALIMPIATALKILLTASFWGFTLASIKLRRQFGADQRLDWLLLPVFFGFSFKWGFFTFLVSAPLGILFVAQALRYSNTPSLAQGVAIFFGGLALFFCHGLIFIMCMATGCLLILEKTRNPAALMRLWLPYLSMVPVTIAYFVSAQANTTTSQFDYGTLVKWSLEPYRIVQFITFPFGNEYNTKLVNMLGVLAFFSPLLLGCKLNHNRQAFIPFGVITMIWLVVPHFAMKTFFLYERFSLFIFPFYALLFKPQRIGDRAILGGTSAITHKIAPYLLPLIATLLMAMNSMQFIAFNKESRSFEHVIGKIPEGAKVLALIMDRHSNAAHHPSLYIHYANWYQAEHKGIVDFNFAWFSPQPVRYRTEALPKIKPGFEWRPEKFNWNTHGGNNYDYFLVRRTERPDLMIFRNNHCKIAHVATSASWHAYKKISCRNITQEELHGNS